MPSWDGSSTPRPSRTVPARWRRTGLLTVALALVAFGAACSSSGTSSSDANGSGSSAAPATTTPQVLRVLVTNDDGVAAAGIDAVVQGLAAQPGVEVTVVAPATNQSGSGGKTTDGPLTVTDATTAGGYPAKAVDGYPADTIVWAIDQHGIDFTPDLVVSGINNGQNIGSLVDISGTVGAARAAADRGIPALAASQGLGDPPDYATGVREVLDVLGQQRAALASGADRSPVLLVSLNVPTCTAGSVRGLVDAPVATSDAGRDLAHSDCTSTATDPADDVAAFTEGFAVLSDLPLQPAAAS